MKIRIFLFAVCAAFLMGCGSSSNSAQQIAEDYARVINAGYDTITTIENMVALKKLARESVQPRLDEVAAKYAGDEANLQAFMMAFEQKANFLTPEFNAKYKQLFDERKNRVTPDLTLFFLHGPVYKAKWNDMAATFDKEGTLVEFKVSGWEKPIYRDKQGRLMELDKLRFQWNSQNMPVVITWELRMTQTFEIFYPKFDEEGHVSNLRFSDEPQDIDAYGNPLKIINKGQYSSLLWPTITREIDYYELEE